MNRRLQQWREKNGLTLQQVSDAVSRYWPVSVPSISNYMRDDAKGKPPSIDFLRALGRAYPRQVSIEAILFGDDPPPGPLLGTARQWEPPADWETDRSVTAYPDFDEADVAAGVLLYEVASADLRYEDSDEDAGESAAPLRELDQIIENLLMAPFAHPQHFLTLEELQRHERVTYANAALVALRPLLRAFYKGERSIPQKPPNKEEDAACAEVTDG